MRGPFSLRTYLWLAYWVTTRLDRYVFRKISGGLTRYWWWAYDGPVYKALKRYDDSHPEATRNTPKLK